MKLIPTALSLSLVAILVAVFGFAGVIRAENEDVTGYAWSPNIGWIAMQGVKIDSETGLFSGEAWSPNIGWVSFAGGSDIAGCPNASNPRVANGVVSGTARATNGGEEGYSGCIDLSGVSIAQSGSGVQGEFSGYAWGGGVIGWIGFDGVYVNIDPAVTADVNLFVSDGDNPVPATGNQTVTLSWYAQNVTSCDASDLDGGSSSAPATGARDVTLPNGVDSREYTIVCQPSSGGASVEDSITIWRQGTEPPPDAEDPDPVPVFEEF